MIDIDNHVAEVIGSGIEKGIFNIDDFFGYYICENHINTINLNDLDNSIKSGFKSYLGHLNSGHLKVLRNAKENVIYDDFDIKINLEHSVCHGKDLIRLYYKACLKNSLFKFTKRIKVEDVLRFASNELAEYILMNLNLFRE